MPFYISGIILKHCMMLIMQWRGGTFEEYIMHWVHCKEWEKKCFLEIGTSKYFLAVKKEERVGIGCDKNDMMDCLGQCFIFSFGFCHITHVVYISR